jgi:hypothetical protein
MRTFACVCGARVFFENTLCLRCGRDLGFLLEAGTVVGIDNGLGDVHASPYGPVRKCENYESRGLCNWLVRADSKSRACLACRLNREVPNPKDAETLSRWARVEQAKRHLLYTLHRLHLPLVSKLDDPVRGLAFDIKDGDEAAGVLTGHADGLITMALKEADPVARERLRVLFKERYRTLLGHFRHEIGHYYWDRLIRDGGRLEAFRALFGDETHDYAQSLDEHYASIANDTWSAEYISAYAAAHPWEDWAETFAHYLHILDTLDTAQVFGFSGRLFPRASLTGSNDFALVVEEWTELTVAMNALNRSMGMPDPYPFAISTTVQAKLELGHQVVTETRSERPTTMDRPARFQSASS